MNKKVQLRIANDIINFKKTNHETIFINFDKNDISKIYALIIGPKNTPYFGGYFFFELIFPDNYPYSPPRVKFLTIDGKVRFNPNLYANGKVCLSILGTWPGPKWEPVMTLSSVLLSIQSLLNETPIKNEPGYDNTDINDIKSINYNNYIIYHTYNLAIMKVLNKELKIANMFNSEIIKTFNSNYNQLKNELLSYKEILGKYLISQVIYVNYTKEKNTELDFGLLNCQFEHIVKDIIV